MPVKNSRTQQVQYFKQELKALEQAGVFKLTDEQHSALENYYQSPAFAQIASSDKASQQLSLGMRISSLFATLAFAAAIYFFLALFWFQLSIASQALILIVAPCILLLAAHFVRHYDKDGYFSRLFATLSWFCFALNLAYLGEMFNLRPQSSFFAVSGIFALLLAYLYQAKLLTFTAIACLSTFIAAKVANLHEPQAPYPLYYEAFLLPSLLFFLAGTKVKQFAATYRGSSLAIALLFILFLSWSPYSSLLSWDNSSIENLYQVLGLLLSALMIYLAIKHSWQETYRIASVFFIIFLYSKLFSWFWQSIPHFLFFLFIGFIALLCLVVFKRLQAQMAGAQHE